MFFGALSAAAKTGNSNAGKTGSKCRLLILCSSYVIFLIIGAAVFSAIEAPKIGEISNEVETLRNDFLKQHSYLNDAEFEEFLAAIIAANDRGVSPLRNASNDMNWAFGQAIFFSNTIISTIGYGRVIPLSQTGKIFCLIYAGLGIPLTLMLLNGMVEQLIIPSNWLLGQLNAKLGHLYQPFNIRILHLMIIVALFSILSLLLPTVAFTYTEKSWGILDAFYYCFMSLTTIGLGDSIPGEDIDMEQRSLYKILITLYLIFGLASVMLVLTVFYSIPQLSLGQLFTETVNTDCEKSRLTDHNKSCYSGTSGLYGPQCDTDQQHAVVRIRPHGNDSPSPEELSDSFIHDQ